jgi:hypothetical protein
MLVLVQILANYAGLIYIGCVVGAVLYLREILAARQDLHQSLYSLERDAATSRIARGALMLLLFGLIAIVTYVLQTNVVPGLLATQPEETPTPTFTLPTNTPSPTHQATPTRTPRLTHTPTGAATAALPSAATPEESTPTPDASALPPVSCPDPNVQLTAPVAGQTFSGDIQLRGTATMPNFAFYKFTLKGPATNNVEQTVGDVVRTPKQNDVLGSINGAALIGQPGIYSVGLVVVDNTGNEAPHCTVPIVIQSPQ